MFSKQQLFIIMGYLPCFSYIDIPFHFSNAIPSL